MTHSLATLSFFCRLREMSLWSWALEVACLTGAQHCGLQRPRSPVILSPPVMWLLVGRHPFRCSLKHMSSLNYGLIWKKESFCGTGSQTERILFFPFQYFMHMLPPPPQAHPCEGSDAHVTTSPTLSFLQYPAPKCPVMRSHRSEQHISFSAFLPISLVPHCRV